MIIKINIKDKDNVLHLLEESVDKFGKSTGKYPEYYIMNSNTLKIISSFIGNDLVFKNVKDIYGNNGCYFKGFPIAICEHLNDGTVDIR